MIGMTSTQAEAMIKQADPGARVRVVRNGAIVRGPRSSTPGTIIIEVNANDVIESDILHIDEDGLEISKGSASN